MSDQTVIKPRPGARSAAPRPAQPGSADPTALALAEKRPRERFLLPATQLGPVCDEASRLLSLADRLAVTRAVEDIGSLKRQCMTLIGDYRQSLQGQGILPDTLDNSSYCLCALLDELVLNSEWGQTGQWAASSLLSEFHSQTWAGTHFFELVDKAQRAADMPLLTLQYLCLSLGFKGKYRVEPQGQEQLETLRHTIYHQICAEQGRITPPVDPLWSQRVVSGHALARGVPLWAGAALCSLMLLLAYLGFSHNLNALAGPVLSEIAQVGAPLQADTGTDLAPLAAGRYLQQILQTEVERGLLEIELADDQVRLLMGSEALFPSGGAELRDGITPVLAKIARSLESTEGAIQVAGHTDDQPIATERFPSNWHLSLARATAVADLLAATADLGGRLWPEGRGADEPRFTNDTPANRAGNRRVEITLIPEV